MQTDAAVITARAPQAVIRQALEAGDVAGGMQIIVFVPSHEQSFRAIARPRRLEWTYETGKLLCELFGGATAIPDGLGWYSDGSQIHEDEPTLVMCYTGRSGFDPQSDKSWARLREFVHRMRRELNQHSVAVVVDDFMYFIGDMAPKP